jgi:hypothetical protein
VVHAVKHICAKVVSDSTVGRVASRSASAVTPCTRRLVRGSKISGWLLMFVVDGADRVFRCDGLA